MFELRFANKRKPASHFAFMFVHQHSQNRKNAVAAKIVAGTDFAKLILSAKVKTVTECNCMPDWTYISRLIKI